MYGEIQIEGKIYVCDYYDFDNAFEFDLWFGHETEQFVGKFAEIIPGHKSFKGGSGIVKKSEVSPMKTSGRISFKEEVPLESSSKLGSKTE